MSSRLSEIRQTVGHYRHFLVRSDQLHAILGPGDRLLSIVQLVGVQISYSMNSMKLVIPLYSISQKKNFWYRQEVHITKYD